MIRSNSARRIALVLAGSALLLGSSGCVATRKFTRNTVKNSVDPVNAKVGVLETKTTEQSQKIDNLDRGVARLDETTKAIDDKATAAGRDARAAQDAAKAADAKGVAAQGAADQAQGMAKTADGKANDAAKRISSLESDFSPVGNPTAVHFSSNSDVLDDESKATLAALKVSGMKRYAIEVQGFADSTGDAASNLALSERRANAVVRYLTNDMKVPLYRIAVIGSGEITPEKGVKQTRKERMQARADARRVEVTLYTAAD